MRMPSRPLLVSALVGLLIPAAALASTGFRFADLDLRDSHVFVDALGCRDVTDVAFFGYSFNGDLQTSMTTDGDGDGTLDRSWTIVFDTLDPSAPGGTLFFGEANCTAPVASTSCGPRQPSVIVAYQNATSGTCLPVLPGTLRPYTPAVTSATGTASNPCFTTDPFDFTLVAGGIPISLQGVRLAGTYSGSPTGHIVNGVLRGFLDETTANSTIIPPSSAITGGQPLSTLFPGGDPPGAGNTNCAAHSDKDVGPTGNPGWWLYFNFTAPIVTMTVGVEPPAGLRGRLLAAAPNPFSGSLSLAYTVPVAGTVRLSVHDAQGRRVADLYRGIQSPGRHAATWEGRESGGAPASPGVYFVRLETGGRVQTRRVALLR